MKLATFHDPDLGVPRVGLVTEDGLHPFAVRNSMRTLIAGGRDVLDRAADDAQIDTEMRQQIPGDEL